MNKEKRRNKFNNTSNSKRTKVSEENIPEEGEVSEEEILEPIIIQSEDEEVKKMIIVRKEAWFGNISKSIRIIKM